VSEGRGAEDDNEPAVATILDKPGARIEHTPPAGLADGSAERSHRPSGSLAISKSSLGGTTIGSPTDALKAAEIARTRNFCIVGGVISLGGLFTIPLLPGQYYPTWIFVCGICVALIGLAYLFSRTQRPDTYHDGYGVALGWYIPVLCVTTSVPFFGPFSPVAILLVLGIFFNGLAASGFVAFATYLTCAGVQGVIGFLVAFDVMADPGFINADYLPPHVRMLGQGLVQMVLLGTFLIARASRASSLAALNELEKAVRAVAQREALLDEARAELRRALGSGRGRFTDQRIGNFQLGDVIGRGAMGEVYQGVDVRDDQPVAVKMLAHASLGNAQHVERFLRELQTAATITSPYVVRVIAVGEHPLPHLVMERLRGRDLGTILRAKRTLEPARVVELLRQVGDGITAAAELGIVHRDIKPQNIFQHGVTWKILDFGVSRVAANTETLTAGQIVGTPAYMAPEQARGGKVDHRTDLYALGAVAYRALTGHSLFPSGEVADTLYHVVHGAPRKPSSLGSLPRDVDLVLAIALAKDPAHRFTTASELADALDAAIAEKLAEPLRERGRRLEADGAWDRKK
jgi:eukaryotic-like serine/threonine-protein kinase